MAHASTHAAESEELTQVSHSLSDMSVSPMPKSSTAAAKTSERSAKKRRGSKAVPLLDAFSPTESPFDVHTQHDAQFPPELLLPPAHLLNTAINNSQQTDPTESAVQQRQQGEEAEDAEEEEDDDDDDDEEEAEEEDAIDADTAFSP